MGAPGSDPDPRPVGLAPLQLPQWRLGPQGGTQHLPPAADDEGTFADHRELLWTPAASSAQEPAAESGRCGCPGNSRAAPGPTSTGAGRRPGRRVREGWAAGQRTGLGGRAGVSDSCLAGRRET